GRRARDDGGRQRPRRQRQCFHEDLERRPHADGPGYSRLRLGAVKGNGRGTWGMSRAAAVVVFSACLGRYADNCSGTFVSAGLPLSLLRSHTTPAGATDTNTTSTITFSTWS